MKITNSIFDNLTKVGLGFVIVSFYLLLSCSLSEAKPPESDVSNLNENSQVSINERSLVSGVVATTPETSNQNSTGLPQIADIVDKAKLGVATISTTSLVKGYFYNFEDQGNGSGFVVRPMDILLLIITLLKVLVKLKYICQMVRRMTPS